MPHILKFLVSTVLLGLYHSAFAQPAAGAPPAAAPAPAPDGAAPNHPLPDFAPDGDHAQATLYIDHVDAAEDPCLQNEGCLTGNGTRMLLRFGSMVHNIGDADGYLGNPPEAHNDPNNPRYWHWDTCHGHWHFTAYANYRLLSADRQTVILNGHKNGFCLEDVGCDVEGLEPVYNCNNQGISVGCHDLYDETLPCQWIDVTDLHLQPGYTANTEYTLEIDINPDGFFPEKTIDNNKAFAKVVIGDVPAYDGPTLAQVTVPNGPTGATGASVTDASVHNNPVVAGGRNRRRKRWLQSW
ncbi:Lysyl oxidase-domain-containing protein [Fimicolochytrium jonesii]|uniref:Lysyl oxidase-domain-containing protein n=1 Tax=Fimicolochytrium jonesii TaxID=1396493 RepID=UPI0022FE705C|nr:Lysyl oxidase-domain-containing protein [Fimicolochytrium jonesii]KAI8821979.1 Lysyl oxidase-domain-containing protein [Fimicolochytrium jonesii]